MKEFSPKHGPWDLEKLRALTMGLGKISSLPSGVEGSQIPGLGGTPEKRHKTCQN